MFNLARRTAILGTTALVTAVAVAGCSPSEPTAPSGEDVLHIGIAQIVSHEALDAAREGFKQGLEENGFVEGVDVVFDEQNAQGDQANAASIAGLFASSDLDLILAISTPMAQAIGQAISDVPILVTAASPYEAGLVESEEVPGTNVTGTTDYTPMSLQLELIRELAPNAKTLGVVYNSGETSALEQVERLREDVAEFGFELKESTVTNSNEVQQAASALDVDAFYVPLDNTLATAMPIIESVAVDKQIPVVVGDRSMAEGGAIASQGVNYFDLGYQTALMALEIFNNGADPATMSVQNPSEYELTINLPAAERMGVTVPQRLIDQADNLLK